MGIAENIQAVRERLDRAARACGRPESDIILVAISKTVAIESIAGAVEAGLLRFGENRVQEAAPKIDFFENKTSLEWHLVGHLQTNKARRATELFHVIHSVDNLKLARKISQSCVEQGKNLSVLIQVDLGEETTKFGAARDQIRELVSETHSLPGVILDGLMTIPPFFDDPEQTRPFFAELREMRDRLEMEQPGCLGSKHLSMGMSHDFEVAIAEGATMVRIGTALFGPRPGN